MIAEVQHRPLTDVRRRRFTIAEFYRLHEVGIIAEDERVEYLDGDVLTMAPPSGRHIWSTIRLTRLVYQADGCVHVVSVRNPLRIGDEAFLLPDLALLQRDEASNAIPIPPEVLLIVEVADSSRNYDRNVKFPRYAAAGIAESWLCDLVAERIERHSEPSAGGYRQIVWAGRGETLTSVILPGLIVAVDTILGPSEPGPQGE